MDTYLALYQTVATLGSAQHSLSLMNVLLVLSYYDAVEEEQMLIQVGLQLALVEDRCVM